jgi:hypothetical protein
MAEIVLAMIRPQDYEAFLELQGNDFPDSHDNWLYAHDKTARKHQGASWIVIKVDIYPADFEQTRTETTPTQTNLDACAYVKHKEQKKRDEERGLTGQCVV